MKSTLNFALAVFVLAIAASPAGSAQTQNGKSDMPGMKSGATAPNDQAMDALMKRCTAMRQQMKPGTTLSADMQKLMQQCDDMDRSMTAPAQPYVPPAERRR